MTTNLSNIVIVNSLTTQKPLNSLCAQKKLGLMRLLKISAEKRFDLKETINQYLIQIRQNNKKKYVKLLFCLPYNRISYLKAKNSNTPHNFNLKTN